MAKKWKLGKKYQLKDVAGFNDENTVNEQISDFLGDRVFEIVSDYAAGSFNFLYIKIIEGEQLELPYEISASERKFFKRID